MGNAQATLQHRTDDRGPTTGDIGSRAVRTSPAVPDPLTERSQRVWSAGDYDRISEGFRHEATAFVERLGLTPSDRVLDAACGSGNLTIPAALAGAQVIGFDLVQSLLDVAASRAARESLAVRFDQGTVEALPYADGEFDVVMSMFGVMFAARPERVVAELARVTRPGGRVALANWTPSGFIGRMLALHVAHVPPPSGVPSPLKWGDEASIRERFDAHEWDVSTAVRTLTFRYPHTPRGTAELFRATYGPTVKTFEALGEDQRAQFAQELAEHWERHQRGGATSTEVDAEYLEVVAVRR